ncbi:methionine--tRNA ligase [Candidatus Pacearchaeota archaeon]|nr:methionine--tRNA ligase [Candidatus Pacearchaeota archaeon]
MKKKFYITAPIYYPNDVPHLGHAYTTIAADVLARWHKLLGKEVFFLTGTDEHGKKIAKAAEKTGKTPKQFTDSLIPEFKDAWKKLGIQYDRFIRTTDKDHEKVVQHVLEKVNKKGEIYKGEYSGLYCTDCEAYYTEKDAPDFSCPVHKKPLENLKEESYFFKLSKYQNFLLDLYKKNPDFISPESKRKEIINRVKEGLKDLSITRTSFDWGVPFPLDKKHYVYVWFDALLNYISGIGYLENKKMFEKFWPADVHIIGKDIIWFHAVYWPAMLKSAGIELPKKIFAHGWWTVLNEKMGKSAGNAVKIDKLIGYAGADSARYFLLRAAPFGDDGDFSEKELINRHNNELANKLGNLVSRVSALIEKYGLEKTEIKNLKIEKTKKTIEKHFEKFEFDKVLNEIFSFTDRCNEFIQNKKPWETKDKKVLYELANAIKDFTILLSPFMPETCEKISKTFNFKIDLKEINKPLKVGKIKKSEILFRKI